MKNYLIINIIIITVNTFFFTLNFAYQLNDTFITDPIKIIGGNLIDIDKVPYQISLQGRNYGSNIFLHYCGGTIISTKHILTAAHCLFGYPKELISIVAGTSQWNDNNGVRYFIKDYITHPMYKVLQGNDIAVIILKSEIVFNDKITKIAINDQGDIPVDDQSCIVSGWGYTFPIRAPNFIPYWLLQSIKLYPTELQMIHVKTISNDQCRETYTQMTLDTELCTYKWSEGACSGDSGGPLVNINRNLLLGIVSFGNDICGGYTNKPDGFTRVSNFTSWITDIVNQ